MRTSIEEQKADTRANKYNRQMPEWGGTNLLKIAPPLSENYAELYTLIVRSHEMLNVGLMHIQYTITRAKLNRLEVQLCLDWILRPSKYTQCEHQACSTLFQPLPST